jgi:hypothetical protein
MTDTYYCNVCDIHLTDKYSYAKHIQRLSHIKNNNVCETNKYCAICDYTAKRLSNFKTHLKSKKHIKAESECKNNTTRYVCNICNFYTNLKSDYLSHMNTQKHVDMVNEGSCNQITINQNQNQNSIVPQTVNTSLFMELIKENRDFQQSMFEFCMKQNVEMQTHMMAFCKNAVQNQNNTMITTNSNSNNNNTQNFNINIFLNETCKDAVNINDFIESLKIDTDVIEYIGREGYVEGMTKIFFDGLGQMQVQHRPIHCTDAKRETFYIRDDNTWTKDKDNTRIVGAINRIIRKNQSNLHLWREKNPRYDTMNTAEYEFHLEIMAQCIGGGMDKEAINNRRIIKNLAKFTSIEKTLPQITESS